MYEITGNFDPSSTVHSENVVNPGCKNRCSSGQTWNNVEKKRPKLAGDMCSSLDWIKLAQNTVSYARIFI